jgi:hypothetical protein
MSADARFERAPHRRYQKVAGGIRARNQAEVINSPDAQRLQDQVG